MARLDERLGPPRPGVGPPPADRAGVEGSGDPRTEVEAALGRITTTPDSPGLSEGPHPPRHRPILWGKKGGGNLWKTWLGVKANCDDLGLLLLLLLLLPGTPPTPRRPRAPGRAPPACGFTCQEDRE